MVHEKASMRPGREAPRIGLLQGLRPGRRPGKIGSRQGKIERPPFEKSNILDVFELSISCWVFDLL